jgi:hypothetical protein
MTISVKNPHRHRGAAMLITMLVTTAIVAILFMAAERTQASVIIANLDDDRLRASLAAESLAAMVEAKLATQAAEIDKLSLNTWDDAARWWNLVGHSYAVGNSVVIPERALHMNGCALRWRIEPVRVTSVVGPADVAASGVYSVNHEVDQLRVNQRESNARAANEGSLLADNPPYYHYRVVTEAYALSDPTATDAVPWSEPGQHTVSVQVQRVFQVQRVRLFDFAIFYAATGETGDLEYEPEFNTAVNASIHSNGAIYFGGTGDTSLKNKNYKKAASDGGQIVFGNVQEKVQITGVTGVYRMRKGANVLFASTAGNDEPSLRSPMEVPRPGKPVKNAKNASKMSGTLDLNGGDGNEANEKVAINGEKLTFNRDSRSDWSLPENRLDPFVVDERSGGAAIATVANLPEFGGHPLESQRCVGGQIQLYRVKADQSYTIHPEMKPSVPLFYAANGSITTTSGSGNRPVYATELPLFVFHDAAGKPYEDVWPHQPLLATSSTLSPAGAGPTMDAAVGLPVLAAPGQPGIVMGYHFERALFGERGAATTGLTIRERGHQNTSFRWAQGLETPANATGVVGVDAPERAAFASNASFIRATVAWLKSNYVIYLGKDATGSPRDITIPFFDSGAAAAETTGDSSLLVASQGRFLDRREAHWLHDHGYFAGAGPITARTVRARPLTLHLAKVCAFLRTTNTALGGIPAASFNGMIYLHRTPRISEVTAGTYNALAPLRYHPLANREPLAPAAICNAPCPFLVLGTTRPGAVPEIGSPGTWVTYPLPLPVRLDQAETINWGAPAGQHNGLTIVTPNPCYMHGAFNTTADSTGKLPPCALFADSLTVLSSSWRDADNDQDADFDGALPVASDTQLNLSLVLNNLPTDEENVAAGGSGGIHNLVRYLENWNNRALHVRGSLVVLNRMRYSRSELGKDIVYRAPQRTFEFTPGSFGIDRTPPFAPSGIKVTRMVTTLADGPR